MIVEEGGGWVVKSEKGKNLSKVLKSRKAAEKRIWQIEFFKNQDKGKSKVKGEK